MNHSYNSWPASPDLKTRVITPVPGVSFRIVDNDNVATIFTYVAQQYDRRVEPLKGPVADDWSFAYRADKNDPSQLSCHASGTALDFNATKHPNGVKDTFAPAQIAEMHKIIAEVDGTVQCGEFFHSTTDGMHWEINVPPGHLQATAAKIRRASAPAPAKPKPTTTSARADAQAALPTLRKSRKKVGNKTPKGRALTSIINDLRRWFRSGK